jgi:hypothetical protein
VSRSAGRHPCHRAGSLAGHPGPPAFGECALIQCGGHRARRPATTSCRRCRYRSGAIDVCAVDARGRHRAEEPAGILPANRKGRLAAASLNVVSLRFIG